MQRVHVVGTSGSGKTWLGERLAEVLDLPFVDLDAIYHQPGWVQMPDDEFIARVGEVAATEAWVVAGNYSRARAPLWARADVVVFLDLPLHVVFPAVLGRTVKRGITREELWNGNKENLFNLLRPDRENNVVLYSVTTHRKRHREYGALAVDAASPPFVRLASRREMRSFLDEPVGPLST